PASAQAADRGLESRSVEAGHELHELAFGAAEVERADDIQDAQSVTHRELSGAGRSDGPDAHGELTATDLGQAAVAEPLLDFLVRLLPLVLRRVPVEGVEPPPDGVGIMTRRHEP